jgi:nucleotide-binding universal stress UspA family protein
MDKKILIAVDGSPTCSLALEYVARFFADQNSVTLQLLHCTSCSGNILPEPENAENSLLSPSGMSSARHNQSILHLDRARLKLIQLGIDKNRISHITHPVTSDIAQTIMQRAEKHLVDSVVIARRGVGLVGELLLGSVSAALFNKCRAIPLWIIDGAVAIGRILVPVDGTPPSLMAVDHLAHIFAGRSDVQFFLFHARSFLSPAPHCRPEDFYPRWGKEWCDSHLSGTGCMFTGPTDLLTKAGIPLTAITTLPEPVALEESTAIISSAKKNRCGTIVIGRRSTASSKGLFGGVSSRTIKQTENMALWVIG